jgi:flagellar biosynthesis protein FlhG
LEDQAEHLRSIIKNQLSNIQTKTIAVVSGKGGVGKSNFSLNFAISLSKKGHSVLVFDLDIGMGNIDILMGMSSKYSIADFFLNQIPLREMITMVPEGIHYISGGTGLSQMTKISQESFDHFTKQFSLLLRNYDYIIFDMDAGIHEYSLKFILAVDDIIVITTPEPTSITDAYAAMKYITMEDQNIPIYIIVNRAQSEKEGMATFNRISKVLTHFLNKHVTLLGVLPDDQIVPHAVRKQTPFVQLNERAPASKALKRLTEAYCLQDNRPFSSYTKVNFAAKLKRFLFER